MIVYRHHCTHDDIGDRQRLLDQANIPEGYDAILTPNDERAGWTVIDEPSGAAHHSPTDYLSRQVQRTATMYATLPVDILGRAQDVTS